MTKSRLEPGFVPGTRGRIFTLLRAPVPARSCVLVIPPFAEEMNKCRRQVAETAGHLLAAGTAVLTADLFGTGDSDGEFAEASWDDWVDDVCAVVDWAQGIDFKITGILAIRLGCALAADALRRAALAVEKTVFWQPVVNGRQYMNQFLRLRTAASMMSDGGGEKLDDLKNSLAAGASLEVAGYELPSALWSGIGKIELEQLLDRRLGALQVFEIGRTGDDRLSIPGQQLVNAATTGGIEATGRRIGGEPFWTATEIVTNAELAKATADYLSTKSVVDGN